LHDVFFFKTDRFRSGTTYNRNTLETWVYFNGSKLRVENVSFDWPKSGSGSGYGTFAIGAMPVYNGGKIEYKEFFNGQIDEFRIWNKALPPHEIGLKKDHPVPTDCKDLVVYYKFNKGQGDVLKDSKGANHGKLHNILLTGKWVESDRGTGKLGDCEFTAQAGNYALEFRGDENKRIYGDSPVSLNQWGNSPNPFTCDMWIKTTDADAEVFEIHKSGYDYSFNLIISSGKLDYVKKSVFNTWQNSIIKSATPINDGKWHHIALAVNQQGQHYLYIDGKKEGFPAATSGYYDKGSIIFGKLKGVLDEIRIWEIALDSLKIAEYAPKRLTGSENGLVHYYRLDDGPGKLEAKDEKGQSNISVASLDVLKDWVSSDVPKNFTTTPPPPTNYALDFDGTDDYVNLGNTDLKDKSFTIEFWAKRASAGTSDFAISQTGSGSTRKKLHIGFRDNNKFTFAFWGDDCDTDAAYTDADWHHWACVFDANSNSQKIYRDGALVKSDNTSGNYEGTGSLWLGKVESFNDWAFKGVLDEVRIWNKVRTEHEIKDNRNKSLSGSESDLIRYYKLNDGTGSTKAKDATGNSDGSLNNMDENSDWVPSTKGGN